MKINAVTTSDSAFVEAALLHAARRGGAQQGAAHLLAGHRANSADPQPRRGKCGQGDPAHRRSRLHSPGVSASRSRPAVRNDSPYSEALFRTLKYRPQLPVKPFDDLLHYQLGDRVGALV